MSTGPGKYDELCTAARDGAKAAGAILIIVGGEHGHGFSVQAELPILLALPQMLRAIADEMERDVLEPNPQHRVS